MLYVSSSPFSLHISTLYKPFLCIMLCLCVYVCCWNSLCLAWVWVLCVDQLAICALKQSQESDPYLLNWLPQAILEERAGKCEETHCRTVITLWNRRWAASVSPAHLSTAAKGGSTTGCMAKWTQVLVGEKRLDTHHLSQILSNWTVCSVFLLFAVRVWLRKRLLRVILCLCLLSFPVISPQLFPSLRHKMSKKPHFFSSFTAKVTSVVPATSF